MELYLVQHGEAESKSVDPARPLTGSLAGGMDPHARDAQCVRPPLGEPPSRKLMQGIWQRSRRFLTTFLAFSIV